MSSASAEALAKAQAKNNGAVAGNNLNPGAQNGVQQNTEPLLVRLIQLGGSFFAQPIGNQVGQAALPQLIPIGGVQQTGLFLVGQSGGANVNPQGPLAQGAGNEPLTLFAVLPQGSAGGDPQGVLLTPSQVHLFSLARLRNQQQLAAAVGPAAGRLRFQRSAAARLRRTQPPAMKVTAAEEEEECSGMETEEDQTE